MEVDAAFVAVARIQIMHAVEAAQESRFAATGGADQRGHLLLVDWHVDAFQRLEVSVIEAEVFGFRLEREVGIHISPFMFHVGHVTT